MKRKASKSSTNFQTKKQATEEDHRRPVATRKGKEEVRGGVDRGNEKGEKGIEGLAGQKEKDEA